VALSRCTSFNGLILKTRIDKNAIKTDPQVLNFAQNETPNTLVIQELNSGKADFYYKKAREAIKISDFPSALDNFTTAIKYRNDIETEIFKRYFIVTASRLNSCKNLSAHALEELKNLKSKNSEVAKTNNELQSISEKQEGKIKEQNKAIKLLLDKAEELEKTNEKSEQQLQELRKELQQVRDNLILFQKKSEKKENKISELENSIKMQEREINRLRNLKWYQKIFGAK
jgi:chromosome segregation ATPase